MSDTVLIAMLKDGKAFVDIANATGVGVSAIQQRVGRLAPKVLAGLLGKRLTEQKSIARYVEHERGPVDVAQELMTIQETLQRALDLTATIKSPGAQVDRLVKTATAQIRWIHEVMDTHREMYKLAGVREWQEAIMAAMRAVGKPGLDVFLDYLQQHGHLSMVAVESSGFAPIEQVDQHDPGKPMTPDEPMDLDPAEDPDPAEVEGEDV